MSLFAPYNTNTRSTSWLHLFNACGPLAPIVISFFYPHWAIPPFTPRQFIYSNNLVPLLFAPWAAPMSFTESVSRLMQSMILWRLPVSTTLYCYPLWIFTALLRTIVGYILSRSVGWAYPRLFNHWALYETSGGFGPSLVAYFYLMGATELMKILPKRNHKTGELPVMVCVCALLCWLDNAPWTYGVAVLGAAACALCYNVLRMSIKRTALLPIMSDGQKQRPPSKIRSLIGSAMLSLFAISLPYGLRDWVHTPVPANMPSSHSLTSPLLEILVLSHPRPNVTAAKTIMTTTINSYLPFLNSDVVLSVFTHSTSHPAFTHTQNTFKHTNVTFYVDTDSHPNANSGQYLHLAEAFRWSSEKGSSQAEWVMLVEDDFPLCGGEKGWNAVKRVMELLEDGRTESKKASNKLGGFVGTGGSGLIIHRTILPILTLLMQTHSDIASKLSKDVVRRPADLIIQDCLLGVDPLCPNRPGGEGLVITSRLVMDHIGGMATTNKYKAYNEDKWRCGWRHPFHGRPEVEVVIV